MNILDVPGELRKANRLRQIATTLTKYQLQSVKNSLAGVFERLFSRDAEPPEPESGARLIRQIVQDLGPTYIKFGQWLSVRPDFVPPDIIQEFEKLQDRLPPVPFATIKRSVEQEIHGPIESVFASFDQYPLSTASIAQVHLAVLKTGEEVAVKVQHRNLRHRFDVDLAVIRSLADWAVGRSPHLALHRPEDLLASFRETLQDETDFLLEAKNQERIAATFKRSPWMHIPKVYWDHTTPRLLVMEYLNGFKVTQHEKFDEWGLNRNLLARRLSRSMFRQIFRHGVFHSDPHPGNILFMPDNGIGLIDFGIVGKLGDDLRNRFLDWFYATIYRDVDLFERTFLAVGRQLQPIDKIQFRSDCLDYIDEMHFQPAGRISFARIMLATNRILYRHKISPPPTFLFFFKAISTMEGVMRRVDPDFDWRDDWGPRLRTMVGARYSAQALIRKYAKVAGDYDRLIASYPDDIRQVMRRFKEGRFETEITIPELKGHVEAFKKSVNKVAMALIVSSVIVGLFFIGRGQGAQFVWGLPRAAVEFWWVTAALLLIAWYFRKR
jgi:ubiquinone biosynthesis protein